MGRPILQQKAKKTNKSDNKKARKQDKPELSRISGFPNANGTILMNIILILKDLTAHS